MIDTGAGVIDADYRGTVFVLLFNHAGEDFQGEFPRARNFENVTIETLLLTSLLARAFLPGGGRCSGLIVKKGDRVAQLILERIVTPEVVEVDVSCTTRPGWQQPAAHV